MKKTKKLICILLVLAMAFSSIAASKAQKTYDKAQDELVDGNYAKAAKLFESIANYEDSSVLAMYCKAAALGEEGKYKEAVSAFEMIEEFKDSEYMKKYYEICSYAFADDATWDDKLDALDEFDEMMLFRDSSKKADECRESAYQIAMNLKKNGRYEEEIEAFYDLDAYYDYKDSNEQIQNCENAIQEREYQKALELTESGKYDEAYAIFCTLTGYKDVDDIIENDKNFTRIAQFPVGKTQTFGAYEQDNNKSNGKEAIEWQVLVNDGKKALLISKYGLDAKAYNEEWEDITWEQCTLRTWLNNDFYQAAFSADEQKQIITANVSADKNPNYSTDPGKATQDKVFLLSITEAEKYFTNDEARKCAPTAYAKAQGAYTSNSYKTASGEATCWWWLRLPGYDQNFAASVYTGGSVFYRGYDVDYGGDCVRPALWINLES